MSSSEDEGRTHHDSTPYMISKKGRKILPIPPEDCFDIEDFTNASDWEKFVSSLEEDIVGGFWTSIEDPSSMTRYLTFLGIEFKFVRYFKATDADDFIGFHPVQYFYGLKDFVVVSAQGGEEIDNESKIKWLLSSLTLGHSQLPFFINCYDKKGTSLKEKLNRNRSVELRVSARCSYILKDWLHRTWSQVIPEDGTLPFGSSKDPLKSLQLNTTWKDVPEDLITDNEIHTDLTPGEAPFWSIRIYQEDDPELLLTEYLRRAQVLAKKRKPITLY
ncbi:rab3 GTPase-activating protein catalytic subunit-like [Lepeophtheirus salmonis]|uniref:rab3 GTPase-activating protein catalytic subunit-like n=1 Tax=Lepeophtheirus salmonis TaxID=72036 RepID=UPI003AF3E2EC